MSKTRIYCINDGGSIVALVRAASPSGAMMHHARGTLEVSVATQDALVEALGKGIEVVDAGAEPAEPQA